LASPWWSTALDESTDITDNAQLSIFIRFYEAISHSFLEELICLASLQSTTTGNDIFLAFCEAIENFGLDWGKLVAVTTDGAPSMVGRMNGFVALLRQQLNITFIDYHCIIH